LGKNPGHIFDGFISQTYPTIDVKNSVTVIYAQAISAYQPTSKIGDISIEK
jgi:hypothetical protein